ncbi:MAG: hypothetical protein ACE3L7_23570 [Candidatus Pristimantibacillus sp.]
MLQTSPEWGLFAAFHWLLAITGMKQAPYGTCFDDGVVTFYKQAPYGACLLHFIGYLSPLG